MCEKILVSIENSHLVNDNQNLWTNKTTSGKKFGWFEVVMCDRCFVFGLTAGWGVSSESSSESVGTVYDNDQWLLYFTLLSVPVMKSQHTTDKL